jgi:hypothetical protein
MGLGYVGSYARNEAVKIVARYVTPSDATQSPQGNPVGSISFGQAVFINGKGAQASQGGNYSDLTNLIASPTSITPTMTQGTGAFVGFAVREVKTMLGYTPYPGTNPSLGYYLPGEPCDAMCRGNIIVPYGNPKSASAPIAGGPVWLRIAASTGSPYGTVGNVEPAEDTSTSYTIQLTNCVFTTGLISTDPGGTQQVIEVTLLSPNVG